MKKSEQQKTAKDLVPDTQNINQGTEEGANLIDKSIREVGFARSIVVDNDLNIIAGNKTVAAALKAGKTRIKIVETNGEDLVVVKRTDISLKSAKGAKIAIMDNTTSNRNFVQDAKVAEVICSEYNLDPVQMGLERAPEEKSGQTKKIQLTPFKKVHLLISMDPDDLVEVQALLEKLKTVKNVEIEQSSN